MYIGRTAARRKTRKWGGAAHRFEEHIIDMARHRQGTIRKNAIRSRYQQMGKTITHQFPSIILNHQCSNCDASGMEAAHISLCHPSCNNPEKTFGVKVHPDKPPSRGNHLHKQKKKRNRLSQRQAELLSRKLEPTSEHFLHSLDLINRTVANGRFYHEISDKKSEKFQAVVKKLQGPFRTVYLKSRSEHLKQFHGPWEIYNDPNCSLRFASIQPGLVNWSRYLELGRYCVDQIFVLLDSLGFIANYHARIKAKGSLIAYATDLGWPIRDQYPIVIAHEKFKNPVRHWTFNVFKELKLTQPSWCHYLQCRTNVVVKSPTKWCKLLMNA